MASSLIIIDHYISTFITPATLSPSKLLILMAGCINKIYIDNVSLHRCLTWDTLHIEWNDVKIKIGNKCLALPSDLTIPLKDKIRLRNYTKW